MCARAPIRVSNPLSRDHSELRTTLLGSLLDAARYNLARGADRVALSETGRAYLARGESPSVASSGAPSPGERPPPAFEPQCIAALASGPPRRRLGRRARPADFFAMKGALEALGGAARRRGRGRGRRAAVPAPGPLGEGAHRRARCGLARRGTPAGLPRLGPGIGGRLPGRAGASSWRRRRSGGAYEDVTTYPAVYQDLAIVVDEDVRRRACGRGRRGGGRAPPQRRGLRRLPRRAGRAREERAWRCGWSSGRRTARSPTPRSPSAVTRSRRRWPRSGGSLRE